MRANVHFIAPSKMVELQADSEEFLTTYTFGTHTAKHTFCKVCGITSFYIPRSNPDGIAIAFRCVDPGTLSHVEIKQYDGRNWESSFGQTEIASCSKPTKGTIMIDTQVQNSDGYQKELPSQNWGTHGQEVIGDGGGDHI